MVKSYDPAQPVERRAQYCQMQLSRLPAGVAQWRVMTHFENRVIGHNLLEHHFLDVPTDDRIKQKDESSYPLRNQPTQDEKRAHVISRN